jgi:3-methyladenine DNA glycosylase AlkD
MNYTDLFQLFYNNAEPARAAEMRAYMKDKFPFLGIQTPGRKVLEKGFLKEAKKAAQVNWTFINECWEKPELEFQYLAEDYINAMKDKLAPDDIEHIRKLVITKSWWDTTDNLDIVIGSLALKFPELNKTLIAWSLDKNIWLRRVAIDHQLLRKDKTDTELLSQIIENNLGQTEFFITKAIGWSLRDYSKTNPEWVRAFIAAHKDRMAPLSLREAGKYLQGTS